MMAFRSESWQKCDQSEVRNIYSWCSEAAEFVPIAGDIYGGVKFGKAIADAKSRLNRLGKRIDAAEDAAQKAARGATERTTREAREKAIREAAEKRLRQQFAGHDPKALLSDVLKDIPGGVAALQRNDALKGLDTKGLLGKSLEDIKSQCTAKQWSTMKKHLTREGKDLRHGN